MAKKKLQRPKKLHDMSDAERVAHVDRELTQSERFKQFAKEHGADDASALDRAFKSMAASSPPASKTKRSDS